VKVLNRSKNQLKQPNIEQNSIIFENSQEKIWNIQNFPLSLQRELRLSNIGVLCNFYINRKREF